MNVKTSDGNYNVASKSQGDLGVTLGAIGTGLSLLAGHGDGNGFLGLGGGNNRYVTKDELAMSQAMSNKDAEIALLKSEKSTDAKMVELIRESNARDKELRGLIDETRRVQAQVNAEQMAWNATAGAKMSSMATTISAQTQQLAQITTFVVPQRKVCETGCCMD